MQTVMKRDTLLFLAGPEMSIAVSFVHCAVGIDRSYLKSVALCNIVSTLGCITIQHTGRILFETANMVAAKTNKTRTAYGQAEPPGSPVKKLPLYKQLLSLDRDLAMICSVSADENSSLANLRPFLKLLEYSGHGIPWLLGVFVVMYLTNEKYPKLFQIAFNILFALVLDLVVSGTLKAIVRRPRPSTNSSPTMFLLSQ
ncbi:hypothetical protein BSL78_25826 [Apostichopus japonicus]|uniref:Uncharacterized protein n=1 Tax=Stichopus japonicus TaxID=307972 RepID=A0A2G8JNL2_STIJA|nr:hypothetical protein BSL78_25826 [Apostichopus japonicus]